MSHQPTLRPVLGPLALTTLGIGSVIGTGIFVLTGTAASQHAGPALVVSMIIAATACALAGLCYAELAAMIPIAGSAYTYAHASAGQFVAWIIGWDLVLEYASCAQAGGRSRRAAAHPHGPKDRVSAGPRSGGVKGEK